MKKYILSLIVLLTSMGSMQGQSIDQNYIYTTTYQTGYSESQIGNATEEEKIETVQYFDGLGRPMQSIGIRSGGNKEDIISYIGYDDYGRQDKEYLPYTTTSTGGTFRTDALNATKTYYNASKYEADFPGVSQANINAFSQKEFESSPLNRLLKQAAPGKDWKLGNGHEIEFDYKSNTATEVKNYYVTLAFANNTYTPTLHVSGNYQANQLYKTITKDENHSGSSKNHTTEEFKDKQGKVILKRTYADITGTSQAKHDTYYVYDDYGNLTYVLPPKMNASTNNITTINSRLGELGYQYKYDDRNRLIEKKIPGKGWEDIVYNLIDKPVLTRDANGKSKYPDEWLFTKYDAFGRVVYTGRKAINISRETYQTTYANDPSKYNQFEDKQSNYQNLGGVNIYYSNNAIPTGVDEIYTINYYDNYTDLPSGLGITVTTSYGITSTTNQKGLATVSKVKVLGTNNWITTVTYYDDKARPIYVYSKNDYLQTTDIVESNLDDFTGRVLETKTTHTKSGNTIATIDRFEYDHTGRLIQQTEKVNNTNSRRLLRNNYDDLGQLKSKLLDNGTEDGYRNKVGLSVTNDIIKKTAGNSWSNAGLLTKGKFSSNGYVEYQVTSSNARLMVGLSNYNTSAHYSSIKYAIYNTASSKVYVYESGSYKGNFGNFSINDVFRVERIDNTVYYKKNGEVFHTSTVSSTGTLYGDISIYYLNKEVKDLKIVDNSKGLQTVDYAYNVRGWLKKINQDSNNDNDLFNFTLMYNDIANTNKQLFNGNISQTSWNTLSSNTTSNPVSTQYTYTYDALNRITSGIDNTGNYNLTSVAYDKNGNITDLERKGHTNTGATNFGVMDDLTYSYDSGNKLMKVADAATIDQFGFKDDAVNTAADTTDDYTYDVNGNLLTDTNKGITSITYNHLNLPTQVTFSGGNIQYKYDATGIKQKKIVSTGTTTEYAGNYVYENDVLKQFSQLEGYVEPDGSGGFQYVYSYLDHLGSVRLTYSDLDGNGSINASTEILQERNTYPFGLAHRGYNNVIIGTENNYKTFQGQEINKELGLNWLSFKYRNYDPAIGRFFNVDPLAEDYSYQSPYNFAENRVIDGIELEGLEWKSVKDDDGNTTLTLTVQLYNDAGLSDKQLTKLKTELTDQFTESFSGTDFTGELVIEDAAKAEGDFLVTLTEKKAKIVEIDGKEYKKYKGGKAGKGAETQKNSFDVTAKVDGSKRANSSIARSFSHEAGHTGGLWHPWSKKQSVSDIKQGATGVTAATVKSNLMNSDDNTTKANRSHTGTNVTSGQLKSIDKIIRGQQK